MHASNPETIIFCRVWGLNPGSADNRFRLSAHCANEPHRVETVHQVRLFILPLNLTWRHWLPCSLPAQACFHPTQRRQRNALAYLFGAGDARKVRKQTQQPNSVYSCIACVASDRMQALPLAPCTSPDTCLTAVISC